MQKWFEVDVPYYVKICPYLTHLIPNDDFQSIFARSASAVTLSEESLIITDRKSTSRFPISPR